MARKLGVLNIDTVITISKISNRGWRGDVPQVRFDVAKMSQLGWKPRYNSDQAVRQAIRDIVMSEN